MFCWHVGQRFKQHPGRETPYYGRTLGDRRQVPLPMGQHLGDAKHLAAPELPLHPMAVAVENQDQAGLDKEEMRRWLAWPKQGLAMEQRDAGHMLHVLSARKAPLRHLGGDRA